MKKTNYCICASLVALSIGGVRAQDSVSVQEVTVTAALTATDLRTAPMNVRIIDRRSIENRLDPSLLPVIVEQTAGLFVTSRGVMGYGVSGGGAGSMSIRGIGGQPTTGALILIDGHPQFMGMMGHPLPDAYQGLSAERVEVALGPASALYGSNAMGGVINIITRKALHDGTQTSVRLMYGSHNTASGEVSSAIRKGKFSSHIALGYNRTDGHRKYLDFAQYTGYEKVGYDFSKQWSAFADINVTRYDASAPGVAAPRANGAQADITRGTGSAWVENNYSRTSGAVKLYYNFGTHNVKDRIPATDSFTLSPFRSNDYTLGVNAYQTYRILENTEVSVKADYLRYGGRAANYLPNNAIDRLHADTAANETAVYAGVRQALWGGRLSISGGVRWNYNNIFGTQWIPQAGIVCSPADHTTLKAIAGKGFRNPTMRELFMFAHNPDLAPEALWSYELLWAQDFWEQKLNVSLSGYYINGSNTIVTGAQGRPENTGSIENYGIEFAARCHINEMFAVNANYAWLDMRRPVLAAPEHKAFVGVHFTKGRWEAAGNLQYIANLYTAVGAAPKTTAFALLGARLAFQVSQIAGLFVKGENLLGQEYEINAGYPMPRATFYGGVNLKF